MAANNASRGGAGFLTLLGLLFIGLKLTGFVDWAWWVVLAPIWGQLAFIALLLSRSSSPSSLRATNRTCPVGGRNDARSVMPRRHATRCDMPNQAPFAWASGRVQEAERGLRARARRLLRPRGARGASGGRSRGRRPQGGRAGGLFQYRPAARRQAMRAEEPDKRCVWRQRA